MRPLSAKWNKHRSRYERSSECLHVWHRSVVLRGVRDRFEADCRQCSPWDEQARLLQHGRFACARVPTARLCNSVRGCRRTAISEYRGRVSPAYRLEGCPKTAPVSHQKRPCQCATNAIKLERKRGRINEAHHYPAAHNGLVAGSSPAGSSPLKWPSPVHDPIARNVGFSLNSGPSATLRSCQPCTMSGNCTRSRTGYVCCRRNSLALKRSALGECPAGGCSALATARAPKSAYPSACRKPTKRKSCASM
jgi:hypothetical protein